MSPRSGPRAARAAVLCLLLATLGAAPARAADPARLKSWSLGVAEGLANDSVYCILQDSAGFLWFGTFGGLSRYDGESFATYRPREGAGHLQASVVFALAEDGRGRLWVGTDGGGLARWDPESESFTVIRASFEEGAALGSDRVLALGSDRDGRLWVGTGDGGLSLLDPADDSLVLAYPPTGDAIRCIAADPGGGIWAGTEGGGLLRVARDGSATSHRHRAEDPASLGDDTVRSLLLDRAGRLWAGLGNGGVDLLTAEGFAHARAPAGAALPREAVRALAEDPDGMVWAGWADSGIGHLDPSSLELRPPPAGDRAMTRALYRDRGGLVWAGLKGGGIRAYNVASEHFLRFERLEGGEPIRHVRGMAELADGRILAGSDGQGLLLLDPATGSARVLPGMPEDLASRKIYAVLVGRDGAVWAGTDGAGLIRRGTDGAIRRWRRGTGTKGSLSRDVVWSLLEDSDGALWIGTEGGGLDRLDPATGLVENHVHDPRDPGSLRGSSVRSLHRDRAGRIWIGTWDGGLSRLDPGAADFVNFLPDAASGGGLVDASVNCALEDAAGRIWVGTGGSGLARSDDGGRSFRHFGTEAGLAGSTVYGILDDGAGLLWIATATGVSSLDPETDSFYSFGAEDGLVSGELSQNAYLLARDGAVWLGGPEGVTRFRPEEAARADPPPEVSITSIAGPDGSRPRRDAEGRLVLRHDNAGLSFRVAVLDYAAPARNRYALRLEGRQAGWTELGFSNAGTLAHLPPGEYLLRVKGSNGNGVWNETGATLGILVEPPFWGTLLFRVAVAGLLSALVALGIAVRIRRLRRRNELLVNFARHVESAREEERTNAAREVHDEIGQHLTVLNLQSYWLKTHPEAAPGERATRLEVMQGAISAALAAVKAVATRLRPIALDALSFGETATWYARDFERRTGIACRARVGDEIPPLTDAEATALFRVLQEALANVARHSGASAVSISLSTAGDWVVLEVEDDGRGIEPGRADAPDSFGILGMRERCAAFGGGLEIRPALGRAPGRGTVVAARVPSSERAGGRERC